MSVKHRLRGLPGQFGGGTAELGLLGEDADAAAGQLLDQPGVEPRPAFPPGRRPAAPSTTRGPGRRRRAPGTRVSGPLDALAALEGRGGTRAGQGRPVHLAGPSELLCTRVLPAIAPLVASGVRLRVSQGLTGPLLEDLRAGQHDLVSRSGGRVAAPWRRRR
ncbi:hypothetical protein [Streptomyces swartbergensis]|uniref:hypothetical protein n=1 Tax=Streptomyces swartbergensis TaxID=487165 RepID=UPI00381AF3DB